MNWYLLLRIIHLLAAFVFVGAHGATATVTIKLRRERERGRVLAFLELSRSTRGVMYGSFLVLVSAGLGLGFYAGWWRQAWMWTALGLLVVLFGAAFPLALPYFRAIRLAAEQEPPDQRRLEALLANPRGLVLAWVETIGIVVIIWLMVYKPF